MYVIREYWTGEVIGSSADKERAVAMCDAHDGTTVEIEGVTIYYNVELPF